MGVSISESYSNSRDLAKMPGAATWPTWSMTPPEMLVKFVVDLGGLD
jgi:hypothetical protein